MSVLSRGHARLHHLVQERGVAAVARDCGAPYHAIRGALAGAIPKADLAVAMQNALGIPIEDWVAKGGARRSTRGAV